MRQTATPLSTELWNYDRLDMPADHRPKGHEEVAGTTESKPWTDLAADLDRLPYEDTPQLTAQIPDNTHLLSRETVPALDSRLDRPASKEAMLQIPEFPPDHHRPEDFR